MKPLRLAIAFGFVLLWGPEVPRAHHSSVIFDFNEPRNCAGAVKEIRVVNPHMTLILEVTDVKGTRPIQFEGRSANEFYRAGWRTNMVTAGDKISVTYAGRRDGADGGFVIAFVTERGSRIDFRPLIDAGASPKKNL